MSYRVTYGQIGNETDLYNPSSGVFLVSGKAHFETNVSPTLDLELPPTHPLFGKLESSTELEVRLYEDGEEILRGRVISNGDDINSLGSIEVEDQQAYLNDVTVRPYTTYYTSDQGDGLPIVSGNLAQHLIEEYNAHCTKGREFSFLGSEVGDFLKVSSKDGHSTRDELADTIYNEGGFITVGGVGQKRTVRFDKTPVQGHQIIRLGENLLDYSHKADFSGIVTAIVAKGRGQIETTDADDATKEEEFGLETVADGIYGSIRIEGDRAVHIAGEAQYGILEETRSYEVSTPAGLLEIVERDLANSIQEVESIDVTAFDLHQLNPDMEPLRLNRLYKLESGDKSVELMLTQIDLDICNPSASEYHFGRLETSLSRTGVAESSKSRNDNSAINKQATSDRYNNRQNYKHVIEGLDQIGDGLKDVEHLYEGFDAELDGIKESVEIAKEAAQNTAYGICDTSSLQAGKLVQVAYPQGGTFELKDGLVISVRFTNANTTANPTLNVNRTGAKPITTNGVNSAFWEAGQTILFTYMNESWCCMSSPVWTSSEIIGDPRDYHMELEPGRFSMCVGGNQYINADNDGFQVGYTAVVNNSGIASGRRNIHIGSSKIALRQGQTDYLTISDTGIQVGLDSYSHVNINNDLIAFSDPRYDSSYDLQIGVKSLGGNLVRYISSAAEIYMGSQSGSYISISSLGSRFECSQSIWLDTKSLLIGDEVACDCNVHFFGKSFRMTAYPGTGKIVNANVDMLALVKMVRRTMVVTVNNTNLYSLTAADLGIPSLDHYWFSAINGDYQAAQFNVVGCIRVGSELHIHFDTQVSGGIRLNLIGIQCDDQSAGRYGDPGEEGPEIFGDQGEEKPGIESTGKEAA